MHTHAALPQICDDCLTAFLSLVETRAAAGAFEMVCWCEHHKTLAEVSVRDGHIQSWMMDSPLSERQARQRLICCDETEDLQPHPCYEQIH